jgi:hypothetical protein
MLIIFQAQVRCALFKFLQAFISVFTELKRIFLWVAVNILLFAGMSAKV